MRKKRTFHDMEQKERLEKELEKNVTREMAEDGRRREENKAQ